MHIICRDSADTQYNNYNVKKSLWSSKLTSLFNNLLFIFECFHDKYHMICKSIVKVPNQKVARWAKSSSDGLFQNCGGFHTLQQHLTLSSASAHCVFTTLRSHKPLQIGHWRTIWLHLQWHFLHLYACTHSLSNEIGNMVGVHGDNEGCLGCPWWP